MSELDSVVYDPTGEFILYQTEDGRAEVQLRPVEGTVWLTQRGIAELLDKSVKTVSDHLSNIFEEGECDPGATIRKFRIVQTEGDRDVQRLVDHYNLDVILAVGYRVRGPRGTAFRQWATTILTEYLNKGFVLNDARLKNPGRNQYFDELLDRIRDIRSSEKVFYVKVRELFKVASRDYDAQNALAMQFYQTIQNQLLYAVTGHTAAELIAARADASKPNMGLTSFEGSKVLKSDIDISKNYLDEKELAKLNRLVSMFLDYAEAQAEQGREMSMADWVAQTARFIEFNGYQVLQGKGTVRADVAKAAACGHYSTFDAARKAASKAASDREVAAETAAELEAAQKILERRKQ